MELSKGVRLTVGSVTLIAVWLVVFSYMAFLAFKPAAQSNKVSLSGVSSPFKPASFPTPLNSETVSSTQTENTLQVTIRSSQTKDYLQRFYTNVFKEKNYKLKGETFEENSMNSVYEKEGSEVSLNITQDQAQKATFVTLSIKSE